MTYLKKQLLIYLSILLVPTVGMSQYKLTMTFKSMLPHVGQRFEIRVIDKMNNLEVGHVVEPAIPGAEFTLDLCTLLKDHSYWIDFYADMNGNGQFDNPPVDHSWQMELDNVQSDQSLEFIHNANFEKLSWQPLLKLYEMEGEWKGYWYNLTYNTTDSIFTTINVDMDSMKVWGSSTTAGAFGNPETVTQEFAAYFNADAESLEIAATEPWTGSAKITNGQILGSVTDPTLFGIGLTLDLVGTYGRSQLIMTYAMSGAFTANGVIVMMKDQTSAFVRNAANILPGDFSLEQNYPNPFNPETNIKYSIHKNSDVNISIYNINGELVKTLVDGPKSAGDYLTIWNGTNNLGQEVVSSNYIYQLRVDGHVQSKKMLFLK